MDALTVTTDPNEVNAVRTENVHSSCLVKKQGGGEDSQSMIVIGCNP